MFAPLADVQKCHGSISEVMMSCCGWTAHRLHFKAVEQFNQTPTAAKHHISWRLENWPPFHLCKDLTANEVRVSLFSEVDGATGSFAFHLDWLSCCFSQWWTPAGHQLVSFFIPPVKHKVYWYLVIVTLRGGLDSIVPLNTLVWLTNHCFYLKIELN